MDVPPLEPGDAMRVPVTLALVLTLTNAVKPVVVDDTAYLLIARHVAVAPADPYGFTLHWYQTARPAFAVLAPPVVPYWLAAGIALFGEVPWALKLWLFPFALAFAWAAFDLARRFARRTAVPLAVMAVLSPAVLPAFNLMLDVPALGLELAAVAVFWRAVSPRASRDGEAPAEPASPEGAVRRTSASLPPGGVTTARREPRPPETAALALVAGVLAALAAEAKYTGFMALPVVLVAGAAAAWRSRRLAPVGLALLAVAVAAALAVGWEALVAAKYGESHFLYHLRAGSPAAASLADKLHAKVKLLGPLSGHLGGLAPAVVLLGLAGFRVPRWGLLLGAAAFAGGLAAVALLPDEPGVVSAASARLLGTTVVALWCVGLAALVRLTVARRRWRLDPADGFLFLWFAGEVAGAFVLSPFPAARRVMGPAVAATLFLGRFAAKRARPAAVRVAAGFGVALAVFYAAIDVNEAFVEPRAVTEIDTRLGRGTVWFAGRWGFQYSAEARGWRPVDPGTSVLAEGDWFVYPDPELMRPLQQRVRLDTDALEGPLFTAAIDAHFPLQTLPYNYGGQQPVYRAKVPRMTAAVYRVRREWRPE